MVDQQWRPLAKFMLAISELVVQGLAEEKDPAGSDEAVRTSVLPRLEEVRLEMVRQLARPGELAPAALAGAPIGPRIGPSPFPYRTRPGRLTIEYDDSTEILAINGFRFHPDLLLAFTAPATGGIEPLMRVVRREDGVVTVQQTLDPEVIESFEAATA